MAKLNLEMQKKEEEKSIEFHKPVVEEDEDLNDMELD